MPNSNLPALLGLDATRKERGVIDTISNRLYLLGDGNYDLMQAMPAGTKVIDLEIAPTGHMLIPCAEFAGRDRSNDSGGLVLNRRVAFPTRTSTALTEIGYSDRPNFLDTNPTALDESPSRDLSSSSSQ